MGKDVIICPNCGAESEYGGRCQYCGSIIPNSPSGITLSENNEENKDFIEDKYGFFRQTYDKFNNTTHSWLIYGMSRTKLAHLLNAGDINIKNDDDEKSLDIVRITHSNGSKRDYLVYIENVQELLLLLDDRKKVKLEHNNNNEFSKKYFCLTPDLLSQICQCHKLEARIDGKDQDFSPFIRRAQLYYNRVYNEAEYVDVYEEALKTKAVEYRSLIYILRKERYSVINGKIWVSFKYKNNFVLSFNSGYWSVQENLYINEQPIFCQSRRWDVEFLKGRNKYIDFYINKNILEEFCNAKSIAIVCRDSISDPYYIEDITYIIKPLACIVYEEHYDNSLNEKTTEELYDLVQEERKITEIEKEKIRKYEKEKKENREKEEKQRKAKELAAEKRAQKIKDLIYTIKEWIYIVGACFGVFEIVIFFIQPSWWNFFNGYDFIIGVLMLGIFGIAWLIIDS